MFRRGRVRDSGRGLGHEDEVCTSGGVELPVCAVTPSLSWKRHRDTARTASVTLARLAVPAESICQSVVVVRQDGLRSGTCISFMTCKHLQTLNLYASEGCNRRVTLSELASRLATSSKLGRNGIPWYVAIVNAQFLPVHSY